MRLSDAEISGDPMAIQLEGGDYDDERRVSGLPGGGNSNLEGGISVLVGH
jgi:hypothetical protein